MKRVAYFLLLLAGAALAFSACQTILPEENGQPGVEEVKKGATIWAGFDAPTTKTGLSVNESGTSAQVVWKSGDSFVLHTFIKSGGWYAEGNTFTTTANDVAAAEFTSPEPIPEGEEVLFYGAVYPSGTPINFSAEGVTKKALVTDIPDKQTAKASSFDPSAAPTVAYAASAEDVQKLRFKNVVSLLKVRVQGEGVSKLTSIRLSCGGASIAGTKVAICDLDTEPTVYFSAQSVESSSVTLSGCFAAATDYYLAIVPGTYPGVTISFLYNDGSIQTRSVKQSVTFARSQIRNLGTFTLTPGADPDVVKIMSSTKTKPVTLCVIPDGFTETQRETYEERARSGINFLFQVEPYKSLAPYFNVYMMWAASKESGASITDGAGNITTARNTAFGSRWGEESYEDMTADSETVFDFVASRCPEIVLGKATLEEVPILMIINDSRYGGRAMSYESGLTYCLVPYSNNGGTINWSFPGIVATSDEPLSSLQYRAVTEAEQTELGVVTGDWHNILLHEFGGHSIARFADEYWQDKGSISYPSGQGAVARHSWEVPFGLNVSGYYASVPWQELLDIKDDLVATNTLYGRIGKYQGGDVYIINRWRSEKISCMIDNRPYFSAWQRVLIAKRIVGLAGETFNLSAYLAIDDPKDPIRDNGKFAGARAVGPVQIMPPLAPPALIDNPVR